MTTHQRAGHPANHAIHDAVDRIEGELQELIRYLNDQVVPHVRTEGSKAMRKAAEQLERLAKKMDEMGQ